MEPYVLMKLIYVLEITLEIHSPKKIAPSYSMTWIRHWLWPLVTAALGRHEFDQKPKKRYDYVVDRDWLDEIHRDQFALLGEILFYALRVSILIVELVPYLRKLDREDTSLETDRAGPGSRSFLFLR